MTLTLDQKAAINNYLISCRNRRFELGKWDCALFVADIVQCLTGKDIADKTGMRGGYGADYLDRLPVPMPEMPEHCGLVPSSWPCDGAIFWAPWPTETGSFGLVWQYKLIAPGRRGTASIKLDISTLKFFTPCPRL